MLGEIFGRSAGLTRVELVLFLFFVFRPALASNLLPGPSRAIRVVGDATSLNSGLVLPDMAAPADGVLSGFSLGVLRAEIRGVLWSSSWIVESVRERSGLSIAAASGRVRSSSIGGMSGDAMKFGDC